MEKINANEFAILSFTLWKDFVAYLKNFYENECELSDGTPPIMNFANVSCPNEFIQDINDEELGIYKFYKTSYKDKDYIIVWCTWASGLCDEWIIGFNLTSCSKFENDDIVDNEFVTFLSNEFANII